MWVIAYALGLLGAFVFIPFVGLYNAFVLGFLGPSVLASATRAALVGFAVFAATGMLSGWFISLFRPKSPWLPACFSLLSTGVILVAASVVSHKTVGVAKIQEILPLPATTGRPDLDRLAMALKADYHTRGEIPLYLPGKDCVVPLSELQPSLRLLPKGFAVSPYSYCNLSSPVWTQLRNYKPGKWPILWSVQPDVTSNYVLISVDLRTDIFSDELVTQDSLNQALNELEAAVRKQTGDTNFSLLSQP
jgi:hypothetical protein